MLLNFCSDWTSIHVIGCFAWILKSMDIITRLSLTTWNITDFFAPSPVEY